MKNKNKEILGFY